MVIIMVIFIFYVTGFFFPFFRSGAIVGARTLEYLLEKSRLVTQVRLHTGLQHDGACLG